MSSAYEGAPTRVCSYWLLPSEFNLAQALVSAMNGEGA